MSLRHSFVAPLYAFTLGAALLSYSCGAAQRPDGGTGPLLHGNVVPELTALDQRGLPVRVGGSNTTFTVVYFYPKDGTPGCTAEACAFRDVWQKYQAANVTIVGVSNDDQKSHAQFSKEQNLPFSLVADTDSTWANTFGVKSFAGFHSRVTFLIGTNGVVLKTYHDIDAGVHANEILNDIQTYRSNARVSPPSKHSASGDALAPAPRPLERAVPSVHLKLQASQPVGTGDEREFWLGATLTPPAGSHLYWKHSGEVGLPTHVEFSAPENWHVGEVQYPGPSLLTTERGQVTYAYDGPVTIVAHVRTNAPLADTSIQVHGVWLSCDVRCVKEQDTASLTFTNGVALAPWLDMDTTLPRLTQLDNPLTLKATFDASSRVLSVGSLANDGVTVVDVFPEQDLGPDDRAPERLNTASGKAMWKWRAATIPPFITVHATFDKQAGYYRLVL